ncbi:MAG: cell envelope-related transcriptional attenuator [Lacrimispora sp.]|jgi:LCP family protein required for cell wall assembly|nr:cell envelope-related transcriptional attenuator [Lacrimispora sp.]
MRNDFDDELNRENSRKERRSSDSKPDSAGSSRQEGRDSKRSVNDGDSRTYRKQPSVEDNGQPMFKGQSSAGKQQAPTGGTRRQPEENRTRTAVDQENRRNRAGKDEGKTPANDQIVIGDGVSRQQPRISPQEKAAAASRLAAHTEKKRRIRKFIILAVAELFTLALIFSYAYVARLMGSIQKPDNFNANQVRNEVMSQEQKKHMTGYRTIAVFGVDSRDGNVNKGTNADVIMLCNINRGTGEIKIVSVFRDTYLNINEGSTYNKINAAYANGGAAQALAALNKNLDLDVTEYVTFNWKSVADGINMLGGVDIDISKAEFRYINSFITETVERTDVPSVHLKAAGPNHLDGVQAVAYARLRKMDTDFARTERQRLVIEKSFEKAKKADLGLLNRILLMEVDQIGSNLTFSDFTELLLDIGKYHIGETGGFPYARGDMTIGKKGDCVIPQTLETNVVQLHKFLFDKDSYVPSDMVKKISAKIAADSGMYKQGTNIDHVPTDKGYDEDKTKPAVKETKGTEAEETSKEETVESTDEFGNPVKPTESSENAIGPTKETKPSETTKGTGKPGETKPTTSGNSETTTAEAGPGTKETTKAAVPEETKAMDPGPGETPTKQQSGTAPTTAAAVPGGSSDAVVVPAPPTN